MTVMSLVRVVRSPAGFHRPADARFLGTRV